MTNQIIKYGKKNAEQKAAKTLPRQGTNKSKIGSFLRFSYYYVDYVFGQNYIWLKYVLRNYVVIYDRYYFDFIVDGKRSNINLHSNFTKYLYKLVCKPNANFLLYAPAVVILKRKQELDEAAITELTTNYLQLFQELQKTSKVSYVSIENIDIEKSIDTIVQCYIKIV